MKKLIIIFTLLFSHNTYASCQIKADVKGLVCDFCARSLEKIFSKRDEVTNIKVDLNKGEVLINLKKNKTLKSEIIKKLIADSGYNVTKINNDCK